MSEITNKKLWILTAVSWMAAIIALATIYGNLAVGFSWTLPVVGTVPGPPTSLQQTILTSMLLISLIVGHIVSLFVFIKGSMQQRLVTVAPGLLFVGAMIFIFLEMITK